MVQTTSKLNIFQTISCKKTPAMNYSSSVVILHKDAALVTLLHAAHTAQQVRCITTSDGWYGETMDRYSDCDCE